MSSPVKPLSPRSLRLASGLALLAALGACDDLPMIGGASGSAGQEASAASGTAAGVVRIEERDVERPDIYSTEDRALWDGRFSLGGRWVAVPEDINAARVNITNLANGQQIEGALFRREVTLPGPPIMVSMDAAIALGMEAGSPVNMRIVVVRSEAIEVQAPPTATVAEAGTEAGADVGAEVVEAGVETAAAAGATATAAAATVAAAPAPAVAGDSLQTSVLDALQSVAPPPPPPVAVPAAPVAAAAEDSPPAQDIAGVGQFNIQVAGGTNRSGAEAVVRRLKDANVTASVQDGTSQGKPFYRVIAGPYPDRAAFEAALGQIRKLGYSDAFAVN
ncbi:SPOR domain-containing protein [Oceanibium sediminis]|uniref:SPOR domain-containing protein n=1 Tax=Oceanibium sediminis TaxID=2026339 RepID=UPI000DD49F47|nr:SPOR domain-containing protein [Oceanibium sediminis]